MSAGSGDKDQFRACNCDLRSILSLNKPSCLYFTIHWRVWRKRRRKKTTIWWLKHRMQQPNKQWSWSSQKTYIISAMKQMGAVALNITHYWTAHEYWTAKFMEEGGLPFFYCYSCSHCFRCCILNWHWNGLLMCVSVKQKRIMFSYVTLNFASVLRAVCVPKDSVKVNLVKLVHCHWSQTAFIFLLQRQFWLNYYIFVYWLLLWYVRYGSLPQISLHLGSKNKLEIN